MPSPCGLFVGLATLDAIYRVDALPAADEKIAAREAAIAAGGPAANAAVAFAHLGGRATVAAALGQHPVAAFIRADLAACGVAVEDLAPDRQEPPALSSALVTAATGDRAVVSRNALGAAVPADRLPASWTDGTRLDGVDWVLADGHQMAAGAAIARRARERGIPVAIDGGSWKPGFETILAATDLALCSARFAPPGCPPAGDDPHATFAFLADLGVARSAITRGDRPVLYRERGDRPGAIARATVGGEIPVPTVVAADTLGAGDFFHGAFAYFWLEQFFSGAAARSRGISQDDAFPAALSAAAAVAARSCTQFGTRAWLAKPAIDPPPC